MIIFCSLFLLFYAWHGLGVTIGYHRLLAHRSFKCPKIVEYFFVLGGYLAFQGSPIWWGAMHRAHHRYTDTPLDPHSPQYGLRRAYYGWMLDRKYPSHIDPNLQCKDLNADPIYCFLDRYRENRISLIIGILFRCVLWACFGWMVALASILAGLAVSQIPLMLNVACHIPKLGYKTYASADDSVNVWWVGLLGLGEGWHNNHHAFPASARTGLKIYELDVSWITLRLLKMLRLVSWMNEAKLSSIKVPVEKNLSYSASSIASGWHKK